VIWRQGFADTFYYESRARFEDDLLPYALLKEGFITVKAKLSDMRF
jgi:hypothetical protein